MRCVTGIKCSFYIEVLHSYIHLCTFLLYNAYLIVTELNTNVLSHMEVTTTWKHHEVSKYISCYKAVNTLYNHKTLNVLMYRLYDLLLSGCEHPYLGIAICHSHIYITVLTYSLRSTTQ